MNKRGKFFLCIVLFLFVGMSIIGMFIQKEVEHQFYKTIPTEATKLGNRMFDNLIDQNYEIVANSFVMELRENPDFINDIKELSDKFSRLGDFVAKDKAGYHVRVSNGIIYYEVVEELQFSNTYLLYSYKLTNQEGELKAYNINLQTSNQSLKEKTKFSLENKSMMHYLVIVFMILSLGFSIITASICFSHDQKRRVLWSLFALCGIGMLTLVWDSGDMTLKLLTFGFPTGEITKAGTYAPFIFKVRFPIGAVLYWFVKHRSNVKKTDQKLEAVVEENNDHHQDTYNSL